MVVAAEQARGDFCWRLIDDHLVKQMEADPQPEPVRGLYSLGTMETSDDLVLIVGHAGGGSDWPYTTAMHVWTSDPPVAVAVLAPAQADHATGIHDVFMQLHRIAAPPAEASP